MSLTLTYDATLSRVRAAVTGLVDAAQYELQRSTNEIRWTTVRGGAALAPTSGAVSLDDYEFAADVQNFYRLRGPVLADNFNRSAASGWGTATSGQSWNVLVGTAAEFSATGTVGRMQHTAVNAEHRIAVDVGSPDQEVLVDLVVPPATATGASISGDIWVRATDASNNYRVLVLLQTDGQMSIGLGKTVGNSFTNITGQVVVAGHVAGAVWRIRASIVGNLFQARMWRPATSSEPTTWQRSTTLPNDGIGGGTLYELRSRLEAGNTNTLPVNIDWDNVVVYTPEATTFTGDITPTLDAVWLKSVARPFLNRTVRVGEYSPFTRPSRAGVFDIVGRELPIGVTDVMGSKRLSVDIYTQDAAEARALDLLLASGDILFIHTPATGPLSTVPSGYAIVGQPEEEVLPTYALKVRRFRLPYTLVAAPGPDVVGVVSTWQTVINSYATWADLVAAFATWADVLDTVGSAEDVVTE